MQTLKSDLSVCMLYKLDPRSIEYIMFSANMLYQTFFEWSDDKRGLMLINVNHVNVLRNRTTEGNFGILLNSLSGILRLYTEYQ